MSEPVRTVSFNIPEKSEKSENGVAKRSLLDRLSLGGWRKSNKSQVTAPDDTADMAGETQNGRASMMQRFFKAGASTKELDDPDNFAADPFSAANAHGAKDDRKGMFIDAASMKEKLRQNMDKPKYTVVNFYHRQGLFQFIATHRYFEGATLSVIAFNALWISIDTDYNHAEMLIGAEPIFQIVEQFFCTYFSFEWFVRFMAFKKKRNGCRDAWFVFDSIMVFMMVAETWVMTAIMLATGAGGSGGMGNASILRLARLLRLSRMARMARLLRAMPELMILIKGMVAAMRSVFFTMLLLTILVYVFAILFTQLTAETIAGELYFYNVPKSMHTLLLDGTILDNVGTIVRALGDESPIFAAIFYVFVLLSSLTVMNMLIGVLCEVVSAVASTEKEALTVGYVQEQLEAVLKHTGLDEDGDGEISMEEFKSILENAQATRMLQEVGVDVEGLIDVADFIFEQGDGEEQKKEPSKEAKDDDESLSECTVMTEPQPKNLTFSKFMQVVLDMRGTNSATVKDIVDFRKFVSQITTRLKDKVDKAATLAQLPIGPGRKESYNRSATMPAPVSNQKEQLSNDVGPRSLSNGHLSDSRSHSCSKLERLLRSVDAELTHFIGSANASPAGFLATRIPGQLASPPSSTESDPIHDKREGTTDLIVLQTKMTRLREAIRVGLPVVSSTCEKLDAMKRQESKRAT